jgi:hypothetical protein
MRANFPFRLKKRQSKHIQHQQERNKAEHSGDSAGEQTEKYTVNIYFLENFAVRGHFEFSSPENLFGAFFDFFP